MRKRTKKHEYYIWTTKVVEVVEKLFFTDKFKTVFKCESTQGEPRLCVVWNDSQIQAGDKVDMKGFLSGDTFIAKSVKIYT